MVGYLVGGASILVTMMLTLFGINRKDIGNSNKKIDANAQYINKLDKKIIVLLTIHRLKSPKMYKKALDENGFKEID